MAKLLVFARAKEVKMMCMTALIVWGEWWGMTSEKPSWGQTEDDFHVSGV